MHKEEMRIRKRINAPSDAACNVQGIEMIRNHSEDEAFTSLDVKIK